MTSTSALMRMARREVWRAKGRSALIILMIFAPIAVMTLIDVTARSAALDKSEETRRKTGAADARLNWTHSSNIKQNVYGDYTSSESFDPTAPQQIAPAEPDIAALLNGAPYVLDEQTSVQARSDDGIGIVQFRMLDYDGPVAKGILKQKAGRAPQNANEVVLSTHAVQRFGKGIGETIELSGDFDAAKYTVVGTVEDPGRLRDDFIVGDTGALKAAEGAYFERYFLTTIPNLSWEKVKQFNKVGVLVSSNSIVANPPPESLESLYGEQYGDVVGAETIAALVLVGGLATLEICLLAGAAFAVGIRRQRRSLALLAATGGTSKQLRNVVLSMAVVLGLVASLVGVVLGVVFVLVAQPYLEQLNNARFGKFEVSALDVAIIASTGLIAALLSAIVPARTAASMDVVAALNGRRDSHANQRRWKLPVIGLILILLGVLVAVDGATKRELNYVLFGAVCAEIGLICLTSLIIGLFGRLARHLPFGPRVALRDAVRNRSRTTPVVAAIMAAVAGSFAMSMYVSTYDVNDRERYSSEYAEGTMTVPLGLFGNGGPAKSAAETAAITTKQQQIVQSILSTTLSAKDIGTIWHPQPFQCKESDSNCYSGGFKVERAAENLCPATSDVERRNNVTLIRRYANDPRCKEFSQNSFYGNPVTVGDAAYVRAVFGSRGDDAARALESGKAIVTDKYDVHDGKLQLGATRYDASGAEVVERSFQLDAVVFGAPERTSPPGVILSPARAKELGFFIGDPAALLVGTDRMPTDAEEDRARDALDRAGVLSDLDVERGYESPYSIGLLILGVATALLALIATGIAAGLALADGQADQGTLAAIGAGPRIRKFTSAFQAFVIALLGVVLGLFAGALPGAAFTWVARYREIAQGVHIHRDVPWMDVIPWTNAAMLLFGVPLVAATFAWLFTRSRISLSRRAT